MHASLLLNGPWQTMICLISHKSNREVTDVRRSPGAPSMFQIIPEVFRGVEVRILGRTLELLHSKPGTLSVSQFAYFARTSMATCSALDEPRWCTHNVQKVKCEMLNTSHSYWSLSWLHSRRGGTNNLFLATSLPS